MRPLRPLYVLLLLVVLAGCTGGVRHEKATSPLSVTDAYRTVLSFCLPSGE